MVFIYINKQFWDSAPIKIKPTGNEQMDLDLKGLKFD